MSKRGKRAMSCRKADMCNGVEAGALLSSGCGPIQGTESHQTREAETGHASTLFCMLMRRVGAVVG